MSRIRFTVAFDAHTEESKVLEQLGDLTEDTGYELVESSGKGHNRKVTFQAICAIGQEEATIQAVRGAERTLGYKVLAVETMHEDPDAASEEDPLGL